MTDTANARPFTGSRVRVVGLATHAGQEGTVLRVRSDRGALFTVALDEGGTATYRRNALLVLRQPWERE